MTVELNRKSDVPGHSPSDGVTCTLGSNSSRLSYFRLDLTSKAVGNGWFTITSLFSFSSLSHIHLLPRTEWRAARSIHPLSQTQRKCVHILAVPGELKEKRD